MNIFLYSQGKEISGGRLVRKFSTQEVGIFETLRVYCGKIFRQEEHLARLAESARTVGFSGPFDLETVRREMRLALQAYQKKRGISSCRHCEEPRRGDEAISKPGLLRSLRALRLVEPEALRSLAMTEEGPALFVRPTLFGGELFIMIWERMISVEIYEKGVSLKTTPARRLGPNVWPSQVKTSAFHHGALASLAPPSADTFEWLMLDHQGFASEVRTGNLFIVKKNRLLTPPARAVLNGVTRLFVIECALQSGIPVEERPLTRHEIFNADEAFLTNTSWEILPVSELDSRRIGVKVPGFLTQKLQKIFKKRILQECP